MQCEVKKEEFANHSHREHEYDHESLYDDDDDDDDGFHDSFDVLCNESILFLKCQLLYLYV